MPHMEQYHTYRNELSNTKPYGLQYNCSTFKPDYVSNDIYFKFQQETTFSSTVELNVSVSPQVLLHV